MGKEKARADTLPPRVLMDERGRITFPSQVRERHNLTKGSVLELESLSDDKILIKIVAR